MVPPDAGLQLTEDTDEVCAHLCKVASQRCLLLVDLVLATFNVSHWLMIAMTSKARISKRRFKRDPRRFGLSHFFLRLQAIDRANG